MFLGAIFDMDGLLFDTEKLYMRFWIEAANYYGYDMRREHVLSIRSMASFLANERFKSFFGEDCDYYAIRQKRRELMEVFIDENGIELKYGAREILDYLKKNNVKIGLATATDYERTVKYLKMQNIYGYFDEIICASMVEKGKPHPDIYIEAVRRLGLKKEDCVAFEDSPNGIKAAYNAGVKVIMIPDLDEPDEDIRRLLYAKESNLKEAIKYFGLEEYYEH